MKIQIESLQKHHDTEIFSSGVKPLDTWLHTVASQHASKGISRTYVACEKAHKTIILGFYSLTVGEAETEKLPNTLARKLPRRIPIVLIGRLAVHGEHQKKGIGSILLVDALRRIVSIAEQVGVVAIFVDAKDQEASNFYKHFGFDSLPDSPNRLVLAVASAKALFE